ncbi:uncharacterized protein LOC115696609 isoform X1 [Cannabis sativa]|uniref:uncharacterized protein LOC115696609 isoform X1 n=1 Tax=Cannabis sativa TaxID=3483 RepID=UPI0011DF2E74|nr:uncharacterized protein LOC115696609 isoform X1 [Cannabis sativa]XP_030479363.1 uncharacterized protein LOC115696609 isoform X1 [Cannabis sativa]
MGSWKKIQSSYNNGSTIPVPTKALSSTTARNLAKSQLGGVIFGTKNSTIRECFHKQLFGLPPHHFSYVKNIDPGLPLFLFNYSDRKLHGIFEAASPGQMNIDPYGWTSDGSERTMYPAQVQIRVRLQCQPLAESQFKQIIGDNYYTHQHFWFELDHAQANQLTNLMASLAVPPGTPILQSTMKWSSNFPTSYSRDTRKESRGFPPLALVDKQAVVSGTSVRQNTMKRSYNVPAAGSSRDTREEEFPPLPVAAQPSDQSSQRSGSTDVLSSFDGENQSLEAQFNVRVVDGDEEDLLCKELKQLACKQEMNGHQDSSLTSDTQDTDSTNGTHLEMGDAKHAFDNNNISLKEKGYPGEPFGSEDISEQNSGSSSKYQALITQLIHEVEELKAFKAEQTQKTGFLQHKMVQAEKDIQLLKRHCSSDSESNLSRVLDDDKVTESFDNLNSEPYESIFLLGGYDGESWLSTFDSYCPSLNYLKPLRPMNCVRSYASVAKLNGEFYAIGGGNGQIWYDTVESYSPSKDKWTVCPSLNQEKGSLAGATLKEKIFAMGGGNGVECYSSVEMLDLDIGRWILARSMLQKRFALAAAELNGVIYAVGGYDGTDYLKSAEMFDPREHSWRSISSMKSKRGCHSLVVLKDQLYALGGYDGDSMVSSVEIFDPRLGSWMSGEPMNYPRGYSAAAVVNETICVMGGVKDGYNVVTELFSNFLQIESFKEGQKGWHESNGDVIGKRCFHSAIVSSSSFT